MHTFRTFDDITDQLLADGWSCVEEGYGVIYTAPGDTATGSMKVWGDTRTHCFIDSEAVFHEEQIERYCFKERGIQMTYVDDMSGVYYKSRTDMAAASSGVFSYVCTQPQASWFKRFHAGYTQKALTIRINEAFFPSVGIDVPDEVWDLAANVINGNNVSFPEVGLICQQIKTCRLSEEIFPAFFKAKTIEASSVLFDYAIKHGHGGHATITPKTRRATREALQILAENLIDPPTIERLAAAIGVDKKTLQTAFRQIAGRTVAEHVQSLRMERALALLEEDLTFAEIAHEVGYLGKANFYKAFEKTYGCTPNELREAIARTT